MKTVDVGLIKAALVWDVPAPNRSDLPSVRAFVEVMNRRLREADLPADEPFYLAARGLALELQGSEDEGREVYRALLSSTQSWARLLGLLLLCWSGDVESVPEAIRRIRRLKDKPIQARLLAKLGSFELDRGNVGPSRDLLLEARDLASAESALGVQLVIWCHNLFGEPLTLPMLRESDPLVELPWVDRLVGRAASSILERGLTSSARGPWSRSLHFGLSALDEALAADMQCSWAGALWKRDPIRRLVAAVLLNSADVSSNDASYGLEMWVRGGGKDIRHVGALAERYLDPDAPGQLVEGLSSLSTLRSRRDTYLEFLLSIWDLIDSTILHREIMANLPTGDLDHDLAANLWAIAALRIPGEWAGICRGLKSEQFRSVVKRLSPRSLELLPRDALRDVRNILVSWPPERTGEIVFLATLTGVPIGEEFTDPHGVIDVATLKPGSISDGDLKRAVEELADLVQARLKEGLTGSLSMYSYNPEVRLARGIHLLEGDHPKGIQSLLAVADSRKAPWQLRMGAIQGLYLLRGAGYLPESAVAQVAEMRLARSPDLFFEGDQSELFRTYQLLTSLSGASPSERAKLVVLSRSRDPRVREVVIRGFEWITKTQFPALPHVVLAGLFDPMESVRVATLTIISKMKGYSAETLMALIRGVRKRFDEGGRNERAAAVLAAKALLKRTKDPEMSDLMQRAPSDRSWLVRQEAK